MSYHLYLGSDLGPAVAAANAGRPAATCVPAPACAAARAAAPDNFANEVGFVLNDVQANDFNVRAKTIAKAIKKNKVDLVGLQEAALWRLQIPSDGGGPSATNPTAVRAPTPLIDYIDTLLGALNNKARTKMQCKKKGLKGDKCYRGYTLVGAQQEADVEQFGDFDNHPGADGIGGSGPGFPPPCAGASTATGVAGYDDTGVSALDPGPPPPAPANAAYNADVGLGCASVDPPGTSDCAGSDLGDTNPAASLVGGGAFTPTCTINGIDGDGRLTMRDLILARKGAG